MRKALLFLLFLVIISGFLLLSYKIIREKWEHKLLSPIAGQIYTVALSKALEGENFIERNQPVEYTDRIVASVSGVIIIFPKTEDYSYLVRALQTVLTGATMERKIVEIDLRFDKPVIKYGP